MRFKSKHTPYYIVQILIVRLIHCYDVLIFIIFLGAELPKSSSLPNSLFSASQKLLVYADTQISFYFRAITTYDVMSSFCLI